MLLAASGRAASRHATAIAAELAEFDAELNAVAESSSERVWAPPKVLVEDRPLGDPPVRVACGAGRERVSG